MSSLRFVTSNLLNGMSLADGTVDVDRMVKSLTALQPDVLGLQEVDRFQHRSAMCDHTEAIAKAIPGASWRFVPALIGEPGKTWRPATDDDAASGHDLPSVPSSSAAFGTGLVTTLPVREWHVVRVQPFPLRAPVFIPGANSLLMIDDEPRVCLAAVVEFEGRTMTVAATHASFVPGWNVKQLRAMRRALVQLPAPRILLGDLNLPAPLPAKVMGWRPLASGHATFPSPSPKMQLDHVLLDDPGARLDGMWRSQAHLLDFSDHRAVSVDYMSGYTPSNISR